MARLQIVNLILATLISSAAYATTTKVGNNDEGADLEGAKLITSGPIIESKKMAGELLRSLNVKAIEGLGVLIPEVEKADCYLAKEDLLGSSVDAQNMYHLNMRSNVYARTFPEPHSPVRFFPIAEKLDKDQLIALHIHEALHRALPAHLRENENIVSEITMAITAPGSNHDRVNTIVKNYSAPEFLPNESNGTSVAATKAKTPIKIPPIKAEYSYTGFHSWPGFATYADGLSALGATVSKIPFKGFEITSRLDYTWIDLGSERLKGPTLLSGRINILNDELKSYGFQFSTTFLDGADKRFKQGIFGRDITTLGIYRDRSSARSYSSLGLAYTLASSNQLDEENYEKIQFGAIYNIRYASGLYLGAWKLGGIGELNYIGYRSTSFHWNYLPPDYILFSIGSEISWRNKGWELSAFGMAPINGMLTDLGNITGSGSGNFTLGTKISLDL